MEELTPSAARRLYDTVGKLLCSYSWRQGGKGRRARGRAWLTLEPRRHTGQVHRDGNEDMVQMRFGLAQVARPA